MLDSTLYTFRPPGCPDARVSSPTVIYSAATTRHAHRPRPSAERGTGRTASRRTIRSSRRLQSQSRLDCLSPLSLAAAAAAAAEGVAVTATGMTWLARAHPARRTSPTWRCRFLRPRSRTPALRLRLSLSPDLRLPEVRRRLCMLSRRTRSRPTRPLRPSPPQTVRPTFSQRTCTVPIRRHPRIMSTRHEFLSLPRPLLRSAASNSHRRLHLRRS